MHEKPLWRHAIVLLKGGNSCYWLMFIFVCVLLAVYIKHNKQLFLFWNVQNQTVLRALQFRWPVVLFWCCFVFNIAWNMSINNLVALVSVSAVKIVYRRLMTNDTMRYYKSGELIPEVLQILLFKIFLNKLKKKKICNISFMFYTGQVKWSLEQIWPNYTLYKCIIRPLLVDETGKIVIFYFYYYQSIIFFSCIIHAHIIDY